MFSKEEILAQLRQGADASDIAEKMADEINAAVHEYEAEQEKAKLSSVRREDARKVIEGLSEFFSKYMDEDEMGDEDIDKATDAMLELIDNMRDLKTQIQNLTIRVEADRKPNGDSPLKDLDDETLRNFLRSL